MLTIDGARGEGGGQVLRTSLALSLLTGTPFCMTHIRARRSRPGLQPQHLMSVRAAAEIASAKVRGDQVHSQTLVFEPGPVRAGEYRFRIGTAGATSLVLHTVYLPLALTGQESCVVIEGGTHVPHAPCFHFLVETWCGYMSLLGLNVALKLHAPGFYPRGGGRIEACIRGCGRTDLRPLAIDAVRVDNVVEGFSAVAGLPMSIAERQRARAAESLERAGFEARLTMERWEGGPGTVVGLRVASVPVPTFVFALGARGKPAERVADEAVLEAVAFRETPAVDAHSADQLLLPLALASASSHFPCTNVTEHLRTNAQTIEEFLAIQFRVEGGNRVRTIIGGY